jgi:hypothetical protein
LRNEIEQAIASADDFLVVDSERAISSDWVRQETVWAHDLRFRASFPDRIFGVLVDGPPARTLGNDVLHVPGRSREEREYAVRRAVETEPPARR